MKTDESSSSPVHGGGILKAAFPAEDAESEVRLDGVRVLLAEDMQLNQLVVVKMLHILGCHVDVADNGLEAVERFGSADYDLILMDCQMPCMDGLEATRRIRELEHGHEHSVVIVACTANVLESDRERCLEAGMDDFLCKPISLKVLHDAVERWVPCGEGQVGQRHGAAMATPTSG